MSKHTETILNLVSAQGEHGISAADAAKAAGVSTSTVNRILGGCPEVEKVDKMWFWIDDIPAPALYVSEDEEADEEAELPEDADEAEEEAREVREDDLTTSNYEFQGACGLKESLTVVRYAAYFDGSDTRETFEKVRKSFAVTRGAKLRPEFYRYYLRQAIDKGLVKKV